MATEEELQAILAELEAEEAAAAANQPPEGEGPSFMDKVGGFVKSIPEMVTGSEAGAEMESRGISTEGAPAMVRAEGSIMPGAQDRAIQTMREFGPDAEFRLDKPSKRILFKNSPSDEQWTVIDPPGMDWGDWTEMFGDARAMLGGAIGYKIAAKFPGRSGKIMRAIKKGVGLGGGAALGETDRLRMAEQEGAMEHLNEEQRRDLFIKEPAKAALLELGGAVGGRAVGGLYKKGKAYLTGKAIPQEFIERGLDLPDKLPAIVGEINAYLKSKGSDKTFQPDAARILNDPEFMAVVQDYARNTGQKGHAAVRELYEANAAALNEGLDAATDVAGGTTTYEAGSMMERALAEQTRSAESAMAGRLDEAEEAATGALVDVEARGGVNPADETLGATIRDVPKSEYEKFRNWAEGAYDELAEAAGEFKFGTPSLYKEAQKQKQLFGTDVAKHLTEENRKLVEGIVDSLNVMYPTKTGGQVTGQAFLTMGQTQRLISQLKRAEREVDRGLLSGVNKKSLQDLRVAAMADRARRLDQSDPALLEKFLKTEAEYAKRKTQFTKTILGKLLEGKDGVAKVRDSGIFAKIFGKDATHSAPSREFAELLNTPEYAPAHRAIKNAIFEKFLRENVKDGRVLPKAKKWLQDHNASLNNFLAPEEIAMLKNSRSTSALLKQRMGRQKAFEAAMKKGLGGEFRGVKPSEMFGRIWKSPDSLTVMKRVSKRFPHEWAKLQSAAKDQVRSDFTSFDKVLNAPVLNFEAMSRKLNDANYVQKLKIAFGGEYVQNVRKLQEAAALLARDPGTVRNNTNSLFKFVRQLYFGPINHKSFALKKLGEKRSEVQMHNLMELILDPGALASVSRSLTTGDVGKALQAVGGGTAATAYGGSDSGVVDQDVPQLNRIRERLQGDPLLQDKVQRALQY